MNPLLTCEWWLTHPVIGRLTASSHNSYEIMITLALPQSETTVHTLKSIVLCWLYKSVFKKTNKQNKTQGDPNINVPQTFQKSGLNPLLISLHLASYLWNSEIWYIWKLWDTPTHLLTKEWVKEPLMCQWAPQRPGDSMTWLGQDQEVGLYLLKKFKQLGDSK